MPLPSPPRFAGHTVPNGVPQSLAPHQNFLSRADCFDMLVLCRLGGAAEHVPRFHTDLAKRARLERPQGWVVPHVKGLSKDSTESEQV